jgi:4-amino-4-deoxy-L-arabinose transferase-like glycosyltransferase
VYERPLTRRDVFFALAAATAWVCLARPGPLSLPYFWDEADVYVPGARWVAEHGLTITPGIFPDDYSRGHPPLFYLIAAIAFRLFGTEPLVGHLVVLPFTVLALASTYLLGVAMYDRMTGFAAAAVLACTPLFMSIGNMMLPEVPLTALSALALFFLARRQLLPAVILGVAMVWIKETGIFTAGAIGIAVLFRSRTRRDIALATIPLFALLAFFAWQRVTAGYFLFPHHQNLFTDRPLEWDSGWTIVPSIALDHGRWLVVVGALLAIRKQPLHIGHIACLVLVALNAIFFAKMFWLERYALPAHPGLLVCACGVLLRDVDARVGRALLAFLPIALACGWGAASFHAPAPPDAEEHTFAYADVIATHRAAFDALEPTDAPVLTTWPLDVELEEPYLGYVERPIATQNARYGDDVPANAILVNTVSSRAEALRLRARLRGMRLVARFQHGVAPAIELYR